MVRITLPNGDERQFDGAVSVADVASGIGAGLAKAALAGRVGERLVDTSFQIEHDAALQIITSKDPEGLEVIRHSTAHLLAQAVKELFPEAQVTIGPVIEDGFYYDFAYERPFTPDDLEKIEKRMAELAKKDFVVERREVSRDEAIKLFRNMGEYYKVQIIEELPASEILTIYKQGNFEDLCRGPHVPHTNLLKAFKLTKVAGAYWRGDSNNEMLQRIYGTAWASKKDLDDYLHRLEEAERRDHRKIAKKLDLFHIQQEAPGMIFWHPNGWTIVKVIREYIRDVQRDAGYLEINTPQLVDGILWEKSGHKAKFDDDMFTSESENREYMVKPMSCPCHVQVFKQGLKSYRDLPLRLAEFGCCHRNEPSGTLHGLFRLRGFVQDDAHIFCTEAMIEEEVSAFIQQLRMVYADFGFTDIIYKLSTRPEKRIGSDEVWDKAEQALASALDNEQVDWDYLPGEGAFYGPKIEFSLKDCLGRVWQCGTVQVDFSTAERLGGFYVNESGDKQAPVMIHRAMMGSFERFIGILLEHYADRLPLWLAPIQVVVMNITDKQAPAVKKIVKNLQNRGLRVISDLRNEKVGFKIREHTIARIPYQVVIGDREVESGQVAVRELGSKETNSMSVDEFISQLEVEVSSKGQNRRDKH